MILCQKKKSEAFDYFSQEILIFSYYQYDFPPKTSTQRDTLGCNNCSLFIFSLVLLLEKVDIWRMFT